MNERVSKRTNQRTSGQSYRTRTPSSIIQSSYLHQRTHLWRDRARPIINTIRSSTCDTIRWIQLLSRVSTSIEETVSRSIIGPSTVNVISPLIAFARK